MQCDSYRLDALWRLRSPPQALPAFEAQRAPTAASRISSVWMRTSYRYESVQQQALGAEDGATPMEATECARTDTPDVALLSIHRVVRWAAVLACVLLLLQVLYSELLVRLLQRQSFGLSAQPSLPAVQPAASQRLRRCMDQYGTAGVLVLSSSITPIASVLPLLSRWTTAAAAASESRLEPAWCLLLLPHGDAELDNAELLMTQAGLTATQQQLLTAVSLSAVSALPYRLVAESVAQHGAPSHWPAALMYNVGYLLAVHAQAELIMDAFHSAALQHPVLSVSAVTVSLPRISNTFPLLRGTLHNAVAQCKAEVQFLPTTASTSPPSSSPSSSSFPSSSAAAVINTEQLLELAAVLNSSLSIFFPALFSSLYLPTVLPSLYHAAVLRAAVLPALLTYLRVPRLSNSSLGSQQQQQQQQQVSGPSPSLLQQSHIEGCALLHSPPTITATASGPTATEPVPDAQLLLSIVKRLLSSRRGYSDDVQLAVRDRASGSSSSNAWQSRPPHLKDAELKRLHAQHIRSSLEIDTLLKELQTVVLAALPDSQLATDRPGAERRERAQQSAFFADLRAVRLFHLQGDANSSVVSSAALPAAAPALPVPAAIVVPRQELFSVCIMFNRSPQLHTLATLLLHHSALSRFLVLSIPDALLALDPAFRALVLHYPAVVVQRCSSDAGAFQQGCLSQCLQHNLLQYPTTAGLLFIGDDVFFNISHVFQLPSLWTVHEFWQHSKSYMMDISLPLNNYTGAFIGVWNHWHGRLQNVYSEWPQSYRDALNSLYGVNQIAVESLADIVYVPKSDRQMELMVEVIGKQTSFVDVWCEVMFGVLQDVAMVLSGHIPNLPIWPFISQQMPVWGANGDRDGKVHFIDGIHIDATQQDAQRYYQFMRRGANRTLGTFSRQNVLPHVWTEEEESLTRPPGKTAVDYMTPLDLTGADLDSSSDGLLPASQLRPVPIRPEGNLAGPQRGDGALMDFMMHSAGAAWVHPIKLGDPNSGWSALGSRLMNEMIYRLSDILLHTASDAMQ